MTAAAVELQAELLELAEAERLSRIAGSLHEYCRNIEIPGAPLDEDDPDCERFYPTTVTPAEHHDLINAALMQLADPEHRMRRLMIFMPPGSAKSTYGTVTFPTWYMGNNPGEPVICASYGSDLAKKFGRRCRQIVSSPKYREIFETGLEAGNRAADDWSLTNGATYMSGGILSGMTGNRAKLLAIDDPVQGREQADSPTIRDKTWDAYQDDLATRLKPGGLQLIIQTRWHEDDLSGRILPDDWDGESGWITSQSGDEWFVISLEAECTREDDPLGRAIGEFLWTEYIPVSQWQSEKRKGSRRWGSLYQQRPRPQEGSLIQRNWINRYSERPAEFSRIVQSWDTAYKDKEINDPSVCTTWGETRTKRYYLLDVFRARMVYPDVKRAIISQAMRWEPQAVLIEDKASGQSLIQELREGTRVGGDFITPPIIAVDPKGVNKIDRLVSVSSIFEAGMVWIPEAAPWLTDFELELFGFPLTANDDQVDSTSQYLKWTHSTRVRVDHYTTGARRAGLTDDRENPSDRDDFDYGLGSGDNYGGFM